MSHSGFARVRPTGPLSLAHLPATRYQNWPKSCSTWRTVSWDFPQCTTASYWRWAGGELLPAVCRGGGRLRHLGIYCTTPFRSCSDMLCSYRMFIPKTGRNIAEWIFNNHAAVWGGCVGSAVHTFLLSDSRDFGVAGDLTCRR